MNRFIENYDAIIVNNRTRSLLDSMEFALRETDPEYVMREKTSNIMRQVSDRRFFVIGFGKASINMYRGLAQNLERKPDVASVIVPEGFNIHAPPEDIKILKAPHPFPDQQTLQSSRELMEKLPKMRGSDLVIVLISGGSSSLFEVPPDGISIDQIASLSRKLMDSGCDISDLNKIRQATSTGKGGKFVKRLWPAEVIGFFISDVPGDDPSIIGSGPITHTRVKKGDVKSILDKCGLQTDREIQEILEHVDLNFPDASYFKRVRHEIVLKNHDVADAMKSSLIKDGVVIDLGSGIVGKVDEIAPVLARAMCIMADLRHQTVQIVGGGETTVKVSGNGRGGRSQELCARVALELFSTGRDFSFLAAGTDGNSDLDGGIMESGVFKRMEIEEAKGYLEKSDSEALFKKIGLGIVTGPTGNNVSYIFAGIVDSGRQ